MKVYIVTEGEYSEYHIRAVFSTKEKAEYFIGVKSGGIEEYEMDIELPKDKKRYHVLMKKDGTVREVKRVRWDEDLINEYSFYDSSLSAYIWAKDERHAIKITNDKRSQLLSMDIWSDEYRIRTIEEIVSKTGIE